MREDGGAGGQAKAGTCAKEKGGDAEDTNGSQRTDGTDATTDIVRKSQLWLLEFEIARVRQRVEECMKEVYAAIKETWKK